MLFGSNSNEQWASLCDQIGELIRAELPIDAGLITSGESIGGKYGEKSIAIGRAVAQGRTLAEAIRTSGIAAPKIVLDCVDIGQSQNCLLPAIESAAAELRIRANWRYDIRIAWIYPAIVLSIGYIAFLTSLDQLVPPLIVGYELLESPPPKWIAFLQQCRQSMAYWAWIPPALAIVILSMNWLRSAKVRTTDQTISLKFMPNATSLSRLNKLSLIAQFAARLCDQKFPKDALGIAAAAHHWSSDQEINRVNLSRQAPVLVWWKMLEDAAAQPVELSAGSLQTLSVAIHENVEQQRRWWMIYFPAQLTLGVGLAVIAFYLSVGFLPWITLLRRISTEL